MKKVKEKGVVAHKARSTGELLRAAGWRGKPFFRLKTKITNIFFIFLRRFP